MAKSQLKNPICPTPFTCLLLIHHPCSHKAKLDSLQVGPKEPLSHSALATHGSVKNSLASASWHDTKQNME